MMLQGKKHGTATLILAENSRILNEKKNNAKNAVSENGRHMAVMAQIHLTQLQIQR